MHRYIGVLISFISYLYILS